MYQLQNPTNTPLRRLGVVTAIGAVLCAGGLLALGATANASEYHGDGDPPLPIDELEDLFVEDDDPILDGPVLTIPEDGPVFDGPIQTIPIVPEDDGPIYDGPIFDGPILTIPIVPGETPPEDTAPPAEQPPAEQPPVDQQPTTPPAEEGPTGPANVAPFVNITSATVDCAGMVNVTYETGATPALAPENEHVVMFSPASNPGRRHLAPSPAASGQRHVQRRHAVPGRRGLPGLRGRRLRTGQPRRRRAGRRARCSGTGRLPGAGHRRLIVQRQPSAGPAAPTVAAIERSGERQWRVGPRATPTISGKLTTLARRNGRGVTCRNHVAWGRWRTGGPTNSSGEQLPKGRAR